MRGSRRARGVATADESGRAGQLFAGVPVSTGNVLITYTLSGDADLNDRVDGDDCFRTDSHVGSPSPRWYFGDFNYDNKVDGDDYFLIDATAGAALTARGFPHRRPRTHLRRATDDRQRRRDSRPFAPSMTSVRFSTALFGDTLLGG
jgi:hypothetical protein